MIEDSEQRIGRPRQLYIGEKQRDFTPLNKKKLIIFLFINLSIVQLQAYVDFYYLMTFLLLL